MRKTLRGRRAAVLGSGVAGLAAAASLAIRGARVVVLEEGERTAPDLEPPTIGAYQFPPWPRHLVAPGVLTELFANADLRMTDFLSLERDELIARCIFPSGETVDLWSDPAHFAEEIATIDKADSARLKKFLRKSAALGRTRDGLARSPVPSFTKRLASGSGWTHPLSGLDSRACGRLVLKSFRSEEVRQLMLGVAGLAAVDPYRHPAIAAGAWADILQHGGWRVEGGAESLRGGLLALCRELKVRIVRRVRIDRIDLQSGRVRRLIGRGFKPLAVSLVVSTFSRHQTVRQWLPKITLESGQDPPFPSSIRVYAGAHASWKLLKPVTLFLSPNPREESRFLHDWRLPSPAPSIAASVGAGKDKTALTLQARQPAPSPRFAWNEENTLAEINRLLQRLERCGVTNLRGRIDEQRVVPPAEAQAASERPGRTKHQRRALLKSLRKPLGRMLEVPGLYIAESSEWEAPGHAAAIRAGILAAAAAAEDA